MKPPVRVQDPDVKGKCATGYLWVLGKPGGNVVFEFYPGRGKEHVQKLLGAFKGYLQRDGYGVYGALTQDQAGLISVGCWAHARLIEKGLPGAGLLTQVIVGKYADHLPLYRQEKIYRERHGVDLSRQTLCDWVEAAADWLAPIYREMKAALVARDYLQADETPIRYLDPDVKGKSQSGSPAGCGLTASRRGMWCSSGK